MDLHAASGRQLAVKHRGTNTVDLAVERLEALARSDARIGVDDQTGLATFVGFGPQGFALEARQSRGQAAAERALDFLREFGEAFGIANADAELELADSISNEAGETLRFIQLHRGLRVVGGELRVYFDRDGNLSAVDSRFEAGLDVDPHSALSRAAVEAIAGRQLSADLTTGALVVYRADNEDGGLAYESEIATGSTPGEYFFLVDGGDGHLIPDVEDDPTLETRVETHTLAVGAASRTVGLTHTYASPVVVCSAGHANNTSPAVVRVSRVTPGSFNGRLQNPGDLSVVHDETVHCIVAEEGQHSIDGHKFEARKYTTSVTDRKGRWIGTAQTYLHSYTEPVVIGQVIGADDERSEWSVFWNKGLSRAGVPTSLALTTGRTVLEDTDTGRGSETVAFMVFESGHGIFAGVEFETAVGPRTVSGEPNGAPFVYGFETAFASAPAVALNQMAGVFGGDGGWSQTYGVEPATATTLSLFIDEDQLADAERSHDLERVGYAVFASDFVYPRTDRDPQPVPCYGDDCGPGVELKMETFTVSGVDGEFRTVSPLTHVYASPVVVCNVVYANNTNPVVTRIDNLTANGFDIKLQNPSGDSVIADSVQCVVVEEGTWSHNGVGFEAQKFEAPVTDRHTRWVGEGQTYGQAYTAPVVIGQVMSFNDPSFSVYWQRGEARDAPPSAAELRCGMTVLQDLDITRERETIGFIVFESGHGPFLGTTYEAATGANSVRGVHDAGPYSYEFQQAFDRTPSFAVTSMAGANGGDGGWSQLHGADALNAGTLALSIDEDQILDFERSHMDEQVNYLVFEADVTFPAPAPPGSHGGSTSAETCEGFCFLFSK
jgi:hypothetical protein